MSNQTQSAAALQAELTSFEALENFAPLVLLRTMQRMGVARTAGERYTFDGLKVQLGVVPKYERLYAALLAIMQQAGYLTADLTTTAAITEVQSTLDALAQQNESLKHTHPKLKPHFHFQWTCVEALPDIMQGKVLATDVMFPGGSMVLVGPIYQGSQLSDYFSRMAALGVKSYVEQRVPTLQSGETIRIIEVGAGTG
ncbi:MAG: hypothetical protein F6K39_46690, partial [Okeania sp. SIO3B3]|nr:hypothetical protein [Okeania sp. SIO3B3]